MQLAAMSAAEEERCDELRREIYEGLDVVLELAAVPAQLLIDPPTPHDTAIPTPSASTGVRYARLVPSSPPSEREEVPAIPADLCASLHPDAVQWLFSDYSTNMEGRDPEDWWAIGLPCFVNRLIRQLAAASADIAISREQMRVARQGEDGRGSSLG